MDAVDLLHEEHHRKHGGYRRKPGMFFPSPHERKTFLSRGVYRRERETKRGRRRLPQYEGIKTNDVQARDRGRWGGTKDEDRLTFHEIHGKKKKIACKENYHLLLVGEKVFLREKGIESSEKRHVEKLFSCAFPREKGEGRERREEAERERRTKVRRRTPEKKKIQTNRRAKTPSYTSQNPDRSIKREKKSEEERKKAKSHTKSRPPSSLQEEAWILLVLLLLLLFHTLMLLLLLRDVWMMVYREEALSLYISSLDIDILTIFSYRYKHRYYEYGNPPP